jgi:tungstate transport system substrate-binding protein
MKGILLTSLFAMMAVGARAQERAPDATWGDGPAQVRIATGSPGELGMLEALSRDFAATHGAKVLWFKAGSGAAMALLKDRKVDMALAHAPAAERKAVAEGWAQGRSIFGANEFWIVGPAADPAGIKGLDGPAAFRRLAQAKARFVSRGDNSGTHQKEMELWRAAGETPDPAQLIVTKDFMTASLKRAEAERAYFLTDSSTFIAERANTPGLVKLVAGGEALFNPYHTLLLVEPTPGAQTARCGGSTGCPRTDRGD